MPVPNPMPGTPQTTVGSGVPSGFETSQTGQSLGGNMVGGSTSRGGNQQNMGAAGGIVPLQGTNVNPAYNADTAAVGGNKTAGFQYGMASAGDIDQSRIAGAQMPNMQVDQGENYQNKMQDAYYQQATSRLDPQWQQTQGDLETQLQNQGLTRGSEAWNREMGNMQRGKNDAYNTAQNQAIMNSGAEAQRRQGMDIAAGTFGNQATQQNFENQNTSQQNYNAQQQQHFNQNLAAANLNNQGVAGQQGAAQGWKQIDAQNNASQASLAAAQAQAGATMGAAQLNAANQARQIGNQERLQDFNMGWDMQYNPYKLQNLAMGGMYTGDPTFANYGTPNSGNMEQGVYKGNQQQGSAVADFAGGFNPQPYIDKAKGLYNNYNSPPPGSIPNIPGG